MNLPRLLTWAALLGCLACLALAAWLGRVWFALAIYQLLGVSS